MIYSYNCTYDCLCYNAQPQLTNTTSEPILSLILKPSIEHRKAVGHIFQCSWYKETQGTPYDMILENFKHIT